MKTSPLSYFFALLLSSSVVLCATLRVGFTNGALAAPQAFFSPAQLLSGESASVEADDIKLWNVPQQLGNKLIEFAGQKLSEASDAYPDAVERINKFKEAITSFLDNIQKFELETQQLLQTKGFDREEVTKNLGEKVDVILEQLAEEFKMPLPENQDERYKQREKIVDWTLDQLETALVDVYRAYGVPELDTRAKFQGVKANIKSIVMIIGNVAEAHPELVQTMIISAACFLLPVAWIARPLVKAFGFVPDVAVGSWLNGWFAWFFRPILRWLGWGELGPIKGSVAAWTQRTLYRVAIEKGSWFSWLQKAMMKL